MRTLIQLILCVHLMLPAIATAADLVKDPLNYPLKQWAFTLALALIGGMVNWYAKVRKGDLAAHNLQALVGELATSAFAGVLAFFTCEAMGLQPLYTAAIVGVSGHMGTRAIDWMEGVLKSHASRLAGPSETKDASPKEPNQ